MQDLPILNYSETGRGDVLVLLHGFCTSNCLWSDFEQQLGQRYRVLTPDLPGFGTNAPIESMSLNDMADALYATLQYARVERCTLVGHALGGYVSLAFAERYGQMLDGLGLFHSTAYPDGDAVREETNRTIEALRRDGSQAFIECFVSPLFYQRNRTTHRATIEFLTEIGTRTSLTSLVAALEAIRDRKNYGPLLASLACPVMFIAGREDKIIPLDAHKQQFTVPADAVLYLLSNVGHMGMYERPAECLQALDHFTAYCRRHHDQRRDSK